MQSKDPRAIIIRPIVSEKSYELIGDGRYTFEVHKRASKPEIADAIESVFGVRVEKVNTMNVAGKPRRVRWRAGHTRSWKKAVVTLKEGDTIEFFEAR